jgi:regulator of protease activity HflC (stomatin/prohibitin superfamily)
MNAGVVENLGKFSRVIPPGFACLLYPLESIASTISLKIQHLEVHCDTKTKDNVFVKVIVAGMSLYE